jgi:uncharacterized MAPEG superfamily protein
MTTPFVCVFLVFLITYLCKIPVGYAQHRLGGYNNKYARDQQAKLTGWGRRALAAHLNGFEAFPAFAAAVIIAHLKGADPAMSARLAVTFVIARVLYTIFYLANLDKLRSLVWFAGIACVVWLFFL